MRVWRAAGPLLAIVLVGGLAFFAQRWWASHVPSPLVDLPAPALVAPRLDEPGTTFSSESLRGQPWVLNVWASWCAPCLEEHPLLLDLARRQRVALVGLTYLDRREPALSWLAHHGNPYATTLFDGDGSLSAPWGVAGVPQTFVIDAQGRIRLRHVGKLTPEVMAQHLEPLLRSLSTGP
jgi:cytochrome c biogenesis protein CcmG/thiol:disulfide interchange protein DsbE